MNFDIDQLRAFDAVMRLRNFRAAAEALGTAQSSLSQQIGRLEAQLGRKLFERTTRRVEPTQAARALVTYAHAILTLADDTRRHFENPPLDGMLKLGIVEDFALSELPLVLGLFRAQYPRFGFSLKTGLSVRLARGLDDGSLDVVLAKRLPGRSQGRFVFARKLIWHGEPACLGTDPNAAVPIATHFAPSVTRSAIAQVLTRAGREFAVVAESEGLAGIQAAVVAGFGVAAFSEGFVPSGMPALPAGSGLPPLDSIEYMVDQRPHPRSTAVEAFATMLTAAAAALAQNREL